MLTYVDEKFRFIRSDGHPHPCYANILKFNNKNKIQSDGKVKPKLLLIAKLCWFFFGVIIFYVLVFSIPAYHRARFSFGACMLSDWPINISRDTKMYVLPNKITTKHEPRGVCDKPTNRHSLFILIVVCSSTGNFAKRKAIRDTWGSYKNYRTNLETLIRVRTKYKRQDVKELHLTFSQSTTKSMNENALLKGKNKNQSKPVLVKGGDNRRVVRKEPIDERYKSSNTLDSVQVGKDLNEKANDSENFNSPHEGQIELEDKGETKMNVIRKVDLLTDDPKSLYKVVFLIGLPDPKDMSIQSQIDDEANSYGDVIQETIVDTYSNLSLKSVMLLKWTNRCNDSVRYIFKTDDDIYANVLNLLIFLKNISDDFDGDTLAGRGEEKEYLLMGYLFSNATPVSDIYSKWYSPRYMYSGRIYPPFLSGTGYVMSTPAARALYAAALTTHLFHLEDVFVTGMCAIRSVPVIKPRHSPLFAHNPIFINDWLCLAYGNITTHRVPTKTMRSLHRRLQIEKNIEKCEQPL